MQAPCWSGAGPTAVCGLPPSASPSLSQTSRPSKDSARRALLGRLAERRSSHDVQAQSSGEGQPGRSVAVKPPNRRLLNLRRRIQGIQESRSVEQQAPTSLDAQPIDDFALGNDAPLSPPPDVSNTPAKSPREEVVLNYEKMDKDCGLRPVTAAASASPNSSLSPINRSPAGNPSATDKPPTGHTRLTTDEKGQLRYFGYSSLITMVSILPSSSPSSTATSAPAEPEADQAAMELGAMPDSSATHLYLMDLFFQYQHSALPIFDEQAFREAYARGERSEYFSKFLLHSLLLRALKFANIPNAEQLKRVYLRRARDDLLYEIENPSIATIPALCLFGSYLAGEGSDRACWVYPGLAFRLLYDFGLHEDCANLVESGVLTPLDRRIRLSILHHCFVFDKLYSSFQGRPTALRLESFSCPLPSEESLGPDYKLTAAWVSLSSTLEEILSVINGKEERIYQESSIRKLSQASDKLLQWFRSLPPELQWTASNVHQPSPATCAIHVQFLSATILLNRPFAAYMQKYRKDKAAVDDGIRRCLSGQTPEVSQQLCTTSGVRISKLLLAYRLHHGPGKFFSTINPACLSAAMALISDVASAGPGEQKTEEKKWLAAILETLKEITPTYPVAGRSYMVLCAIVNASGIPGVVPASDEQQQPYAGTLQLDQQPQSTDMQGLQGRADDFLWNMDASLGWEFYPSLDDVHGIGLTDFFPPPPDAGNLTGGL